MLKEGPCRKGTIETLFYEPCGSRWRISKLKCTAPYHPKVLFEEVASWLQNDVYDMANWEIFDEDGKVDINTQREPRDGERYIILSPEVSEELKSSMAARFKKFLQATRWRRIKSRHKIEVFQEGSVGLMKPPGFETAAEAIHRKHVRYRTRWKQKKKILAQPMESSPLCGDLTLTDEGTIQDQIQAPAFGGEGRMNTHVESYLERGSRDCGPSLGRFKRRKSGDFETQPSHSKLIEDFDRLERQEDMDAESSLPMLSYAHMIMILQPPNWHSHFEKIQNWMIDFKFHTLKPEVTEQEFQTQMNLLTDQAEKIRKSREEIHHPS
jgi:hypothetical protein